MASFLPSEVRAWLLEALRPRKEGFPRFIPRARKAQKTSFLVSHRGAETFETANLLISCLTRTPLPRVAT